MGLQPLLHGVAAASTASGCCLDDVGRGSAVDKESRRWPIAQLRADLSGAEPAHALERRVAAPGGSEAARSATLGGDRGGAAASRWHPSDGGFLPGPEGSPEQRVGGGRGGRGSGAVGGAWAAATKAVSTVLPRHGTSGSRKSLELNTAKSATLTGPHGCTATSHGALSGSALRPECVVQPWSRESQPQEARLASCGPAKVALSACSGAMTRWQGTRGRRRVPAQASGSSSGSGSGSGSGLGRARLVHV